MNLRMSTRTEVLELDFKPDPMTRAEMTRIKNRSRLPDREHKSQMAAAAKAAQTGVKYVDLAASGQIIFSIDAITARQKQAARGFLQAAGYVWGVVKTAKNKPLRGWTKKAS